MVTTVTSSIGTAGGRDYSTLQSWEDAAPANLVSSDQIWRGEVYNDSAFSGSTVLLNMAGSTSDATRYKEITCATGESFRDNASVQTNALRFNTANGVSISSSVAYDYAVKAAESYSRVTGLQIQGTGNCGALNASNSTSRVEGCIVEYASSRASVQGFAADSLFVVRSTGIASIISGAGIKAYNCTFVASGGTPLANGLSAGAYLATTWKNCAIFGATNTISTNGTATFTTCYTDDATPPTGCTTVAFDTSTGSGFENITDATRDFRLKSTSALIDVGTTDATNAPVDIAGTARPSGSAYDVGAWEYVSAGGATYTLTADSGSFALTGQDAGLAFNRVLAADTQSFALTGQTTGLAFNRTLAAASGSFALTGQDAGLAFNRVLSAANGSFALDGQDVTLTYTPISGATYTLTAASGSFALTGQDTGLAFNRVLTADTQSYSLSGDVAGLAFNRVLTADTVSYALIGQDVTLTYTSNGFTYTLTAESGSFEVTGQDASLQHTTTAIAGGGGWLPQTRRKSRKQIYEERVKLGILPPPVIKAAAKVAAVAQTVEEFKEERPKYEEMFLKAIKKTEWLPDYTRAIQAQLAIMELEEEELLLLL